MWLTAVLFPFRFSGHDPHSLETPEAKRKIKNWLKGVYRKREFRVMVYVFSLYWLRDDTSLRILGASAQNRNKDVRRMMLLSNVLFVIVRFWETAHLPPHPPPSQANINTYPLTQGKILA